jgi:hypothetical protein
VNHVPSEILDQYLDDELPAADRTAVEAHLATCPACRQKLAATRRLASRLAALSSEPLTLDLAPLVVRRIAEPAARTSRLGTALLVGQLAAVVALVLWFVAQQATPGAIALDWSWLPAPFDAALDWLGLVQDGLAAVLGGSSGAPILTPAEPITSIGAPALLVALAIWLVANGLLLTGRAAAARGRGSA